MRQHTSHRAVLAIGLLTGLALPASAQVEDEPYADPGVALDELEVLFPEVFPAATRVDPRSGAPPVWRAYAPDPETGEERLAGFIFLTSDLPPEEKGYTAPIEVLVGMDLQGKITGTRITKYFESLRSSRGDFLRGFYQEQFAGKRMTDRFMVRRDIETVSGATISAAAAARGIRNAAQRVFGAYLVERDADITRDEIEDLPWPMLEMRGFTDRLVGLEDGDLKIRLSIVPIADSAMGAMFMGSSYRRALGRVGRQRTREMRQWLVGVDGSLMMFFRGPQLYVLRGSDTLNFEMRDFALIGDPRDGKVAGRYRSVGLLLSDPALDPDDNFVWEINLGTGFPIYQTEHVGDPELLAQEQALAAAAETIAAATSDSSVAAVATGQGTTPGATPGAAPGSPPFSPTSTEPAAPQVDTGRAAGYDSALDPAFDPVLFDFEEERQSVLARTLETTSWLLVSLMAGMLALTSMAFFAKIVWLRWVALGFTLALLGFWGGDFLSVSHITAAIKVGPGVFLEDIPLLLLVVFTVVTTLLWGRVFCGYLCPFGALQDFMERLIPKKLRWHFPHPVHESGQYAKYGVLGVILVPAMAGSDVSIFQYFEPFGTVFFWSRSTVLWVIAGTILVASAIIPRFYCRYLCPLGAALAIASVLSPFRIRRVPHCTLCTVCEHNCPTGAIQRESIDFHECVRCNVCEVKLQRRAGVCRHDFDRVSQLVQIKRGRHLKHQRVAILEPVGD